MQIIVTKSMVDQSNVLESCFLKDVYLPGEDERGQDNTKPAIQQNSNICTPKGSTPKKVAHKEKGVRRGELSHNGKVAVMDKKSRSKKVAPKGKVAVKVQFAVKEKAADKEKVTHNRKIAHNERKERMVVKLLMNSKGFIKETRDASDSSNGLKGAETSIVSAKSSVGAACLLLQAMKRKKEVDDEVEKQSSSRKNVSAVDGSPSGGSLLSDEEDAMTEEEEKGKEKRKRRKYRPKCSICGFKCDSTAQRYVHSAQEHKLFRNAVEASFYMPKHQGQPQGAGDSLQTDQTRTGTVQHEVLHKCAHCTSFSFDKDTLKAHLDSHCGGVDGVKCRLCRGAIGLWDNDRFEELEALSAKLQEIEDDDQGSGWDRISFSKDGSWSWGETTSCASRSVEADEGCDVAMFKATAAADDKCNDTEDRDASQADSKRQQNKVTPRSRRVKAYPPFVSSCYECGEKFFFRAHAMNHYHHAHRSITCKDCNAVVPTLTALISHSMQKHRTRGVFRCAQCNQAFHTAGKLHYHLEGHLGLFKCDPCGKSFMTLNNLDLHKANYCPGSEVLTPSETRFRVRGKNSITCPICRVEFVRKNSFHKHMVQWHQDQAAVMPLKKTPQLICEKCGKFYSNSTSLKTHMQSHTSENIILACPFPGCLKTFRCDKNLRMHAQIHQKNREYICELCGKRLKSYPSLKSHRIRHLGVLPYKCRYCGKGFLESRKRIQHERGVHTGDCEHKCDECGKGYATATGLKTHRNIHSSIRPFNCNDCESSFVDRFSLKSHQRTHTKPFRCEHCSEGFAQKGGRRRHLSRVHGILEPVQRFRTQIFTPASSSLQLQGVAEPNEDLVVTQPILEEAVSIQII